MPLNTLGIAHDFLNRTVKTGDFCIDATAGKGRDTELLCRLVGETGKVLAFDIQPEAIIQTKERLQKAGLQNFETVLDSHSNMLNYADNESVDCIVFIFFILPNGNPNIFTTEKTSIPAIQAGLLLLKAGGVMSLSIYYGGVNGYNERDSLLEYLKSLDDKKYSVLLSSWHNRPNDPPISAIIWKH